MSDPWLDTPAPTGPRGDPFREGAKASRARRGRSLAIALALVVFVILVFVNTIIRLSANVRDAARHHPAAASAVHRPLQAP